MNARRKAKHSQTDESQWHTNPYDSNLYRIGYGRNQSSIIGLEEQIILPTLLRHPFQYEIQVQT